MIVKERYNNLFFVLKEILWHASGAWTPKNFMGVTGSHILVWFVSLSWVGGGGEACFLLRLGELLATSYLGLITPMSSIECINVMCYSVQKVQVPSDYIVTRAAVELT